jgi:hypothetical protein
MIAIGFWFARGWIYHCHIAVADTEERLIDGCYGIVKIQEDGECRPTKCFGWIISYPHSLGKIDLLRAYP